MDFKTYDTADLSAKIVIDGNEIYPLEKIFQHLFCSDDVKIHLLRVEKFGWQNQTTDYVFKRSHSGEIIEKFTYTLRVFNTYDFELIESYEDKHDTCVIKNYLKIYLLLLSWNLISDLEIRLLNINT